jgi:hypothetical protein
MPVTKQIAFEQELEIDGSIYKIEVIFDGNLKLEDILANRILQDLAGQKGDNGAELDLINPEK